MIDEYFRPATVNEAVSLLQNTSKHLKPMGGGTSLSHKKGEQFGAVDLQNIGLDQIELSDQKIKAGAMVRLSAFLGHPGVQPEIQRGILIDTTGNIRNAATLGGWMISSDGRSVFTTLLLALDASLTWEPGAKRVQMGNWLPMRRLESPGVLISEASWWAQPYIVFEYVARSPKDRPLLIEWRSGRTRIALGGYGEAPIIAMDGPEEGGVDAASRDAYYDAEDQWASALYRREVASKLALRCLERINETKESEA